MVHRFERRPVPDELLRQLRLAVAYRDVGVDEVVAVSGDDQQRAERAVREWDLKNLRVAYGMDEATMRA